MMTNLWEALKFGTLKYPETVFLVRLGTSLFLAGNEFLNDFPLHLVPSWERACSRTD